MAIIDEVVFPTRLGRDSLESQPVMTTTNQFSYFMRMSSSKISVANKARGSDGKKTFNKNSSFWMVYIFSKTVSVTQYYLCLSAYPASDIVFPKSSTFVERLDECLASSAK